jgi:hypothetical protein
LIFQAPPTAPALAPLLERLNCSLAAAERFQVPADVVLAVATVENGRPGQWAPNANGSYDLGAMQLNTSYIASLARFGIRADHVLAPGCYAYMLAAWRLHGHLVHDGGDPWRRVANYNSRTPVFNLRYQARLVPAAAAWRRWLQTYYPKLASVGGAAFAPPLLGAASFEEPMAVAAAPSGRARHGSRRGGWVQGRACDLACAPMRVTMSFKSPAGATAAGALMSGAAPAG